MSFSQWLCRSQLLNFCWKIGPKGLNENIAHAMHSLLLWGQLGP